jgi:hypothetical protein
MAVKLVRNKTRGDNEKVEHDMRRRVDESGQTDQFTEALTLTKFWIYVNQFSLTSVGKGIASATLLSCYCNRTA